MSACDVYAFGVVASSTLYALDDGFPPADGYAEVSDIRYAVGGEAANSSIVLARLGAAVRLDGNWVGDDEPGQRTRALLDSYGIDTSRLPLRSGYRGVSETVIAADNSRTIFGSYGQLLQQQDWNAPQHEDIVQAKVVCLDPFFGDASLGAADIACGAGIPVVTVDCLADDPILGFAAAVVISHNFLNANYPGREPRDILCQYQQACTGLVIFTFGENDVLYGRDGQAAMTMPVFPVEVVDTCAAGDSFRAGIVFGFLKAWDDARSVRFAAALAGLVCTRFPGALDAPGYDEVVEFLRSQR